MAKSSGMRNKVVTAGAVGLIGLGFWLGQMFPGFGLGLGKGTGTGPGESSSDRDEAPLVCDDVPAQAPAAPQAQVSLSAIKTTPVPRPQRLRIIIDGDSYLLTDSDSGLKGERLDAQEVASRINETTGDDQGIRVRIDRTKRATNGARQALLSALEAEGITSEARQESLGYLQ